MVSAYGRGRFERDAMQRRRGEPRVVMVEDAVVDFGEHLR
jgi:hypothetical protein